MNCPQCEQSVAADHFHIGPWVDEFDARGEPCGSYRKITIHCTHCGHFEAEQDANRFIRKTTRYTNMKDLRRLENRLGARTLEKAPA